MTYWPDRRICDLLEIEHPILQAPMAGCSTPAMAAAAANAGGVGSLGCSFWDVDTLQSQVGAVRELSNRSMNLNFFCHEEPRLDPYVFERLKKQLQPHYDQYGLGAVGEPKAGAFTFDEERCDACIKLSPKMVSFHFGLPAENLVTKLKDAGIVIVSSATSRAEAVWLEERGVDAVIAQSSEAGGHNGWFLPQTGEVSGTMSLVPKIADAISVPVIAAGGVADGRGIVACFQLGASAVQIGTAFVAAKESAVPEAHKRALLASDGDDTEFTHAFSGRRARSISNSYIASMRDAQMVEFPLGNSLTGPIRAASAKADSSAHLSLWSGQAGGRAGGGSTVEIMKRLVSDAQDILKK